jgi:Family of unknown function (DUF6544)
VGDLPDLMSRYVELALPDAVAPGATVRVTQIGEMILRPGRRPLRFDAVEEFAVDRVVFAWEARFPLLGPLAMRVVDSYDGRDGLLEVRILGVPVQRKRGPELAQGEVYRYLAEIPWVPQAILSNSQLEWRAVDAHGVEVATQVGGERFALRLMFNEAGEITQTVAARPRLEAGGEVTGSVGEYREPPPSAGSACPDGAGVWWELPEGPFIYWRGAITAAEGPA